MSTRTPQQVGRSNRQRGAAFERDVARWLHRNGFPHAERAVRNGWRTRDRVSADPYDILGLPGVLVSCKNDDVSDNERDRQLNTVTSDAAARDAIGLLVVKRRGVADTGQSWCYRWLPTPVECMPVRGTLDRMAHHLTKEGHGQQ